MNTGLLVGIVFALAGLAFLLWAYPLSMRYNAWTTRLRERHPNFNSPPTPEWRARNTKIMTALFRIVGAVFILRAILTLLTVLSPARH
jgi:uncharacterized membrane protein YjgN (DUF898 family)